MEIWKRDGFEAPHQVWPLAPGTPAPRADLRQLRSALVAQLDELHDELATIRSRLEVLRTALARLADDEHQPSGGQHVASVIERQLARLLYERDNESAARESNLGY